MSATHARKKPFLRLATAAVAMVAALGMAACTGGASTSSSSSSSAQVGDRSPEQIKEAGEIVIGIFSDKAPFGYIDADGKPAGYDVVYGDRIAADLGVTAKYVPVDAAARTEVLASNKVDITLANFTVTPDRERADDADSRDPQGEDGGVDVQGRVSRQDVEIHRKNLGRGRGRSGRSPAAGGPGRGHGLVPVSWWRWCPRRLRRRGRRGSRRHRRRGRGSARSPCGRSSPGRAQRAGCSASRGGRCCPS